MSDEVLKDTIGHLIKAEEQKLAELLEYRSRLEQGIVNIQESINVLKGRLEKLHEGTIQ